jgi:hypothetical protein
MARKDDGLRIEYVALDEVVKWPRNPRQHDDAALERSLKRYGFVSPLLLDEKSGKLVAGHGRLGALESLRDAGEKPPERVKVDAKGKWLVPVVRGIGFANASEAESYLIADNRLSELGGWDQDMLREIVRDLDTEGLELDALGWSAAALDKLIAEVEEKPKKAAAKESKESFAAPSTTRLLPIYLATEDYQPTVERMRQINDQHRLADYTALLLFLLDHYDATKPGQSAGADPFMV